MRLRERQQECGGAVKVIACVDDPVIANKILNHIEAKQAEFMLPIARAPPENAMFT